MEPLLRSWDARCGARQGAHWRFLRAHRHVHAAKSHACSGRGGWGQEGGWSAWAGSRCRFHSPFVAHCRSELLRSQFPCPSMDGQGVSCRVASGGVALSHNILFLTKVYIYISKTCFSKSLKQVSETALRRIEMPVSHLLQATHRRVCFVQRGSVSSCEMPLQMTRDSETGLKQPFQPLNLIEELLSEQA